ncbi:TetR/AcrR family transcriptional regulator [Rothia uropygialis]|uniref:TetR/AcrR family transcriptional regulator n=1 Tax=Kocuria sp. 36 TaxID=1415402 RepID=UPI00101E1B23|nr:TetR/AcrR family transcriptional regulator [Kocuria sp. 36]
MSIVPPRVQPASTRGATQDRRSLVREQNRHAIAAAAAALVRREGPQSLNVDELAARAGVSRRTVFNHFSSIEEAAFAQINDDFDQLADGFRISPGHNEESMASHVTHAFTEFVLRPEVLENIRESVSTASQMVNYQGLTTWGQSSMQRMINRLIEIVRGAYPSVPAMRVHILCRVLLDTICVALHEALGDDGLSSTTAETQDKVREALEYLTTISFDSVLKGPAHGIAAL